MVWVGTLPRAQLDKPGYDCHWEGTSVDANLWQWVGTSRVAKRWQMETSGLARQGHRVGHIWNCQPLDQSVPQLELPGYHWHGLGTSGTAHHWEAESQLELPVYHWRSVGHSWSSWHWVGTAGNVNYWNG